MIHQINRCLVTCVTLANVCASVTNTCIMTNKIKCIFYGKTNLYRDSKLIYIININIPTILH